MRKSKFLWSLLLSLSLILIAAACTTNGPASVSGTAGPGENLYILDGPSDASNAAQRRIIAFRPGSSAQPLTMPAGLLPQNHSHIYTTAPIAGSDSQTRISIINVLTGKQERDFTIPGTYTAAGQSYTTAVLSADGRWLALRQQGSNSSFTTIALVGTLPGNITRTILLRGYFELDALSPDGSRIYLLEHPNASDPHYHVRLFNVTENRLMDGYLVDKADPDENMNGTALTRQMPADGSLAYTLYTNTGENKAFVHILPLTGNYYGARCIDLPVGSSANQLSAYSLALSADERTLYAVNSLLGTITSIDVGHQDEVFEDRIIKTARFNSGSAPGDQLPALYNGAVLSQDQRTLYAIGPHGILALDTDTFRVRQTYVPQQSFTSIALSGDGRSLYAVHPRTGITRIDLASGKTSQITATPALSPWGILWVTRSS